LMLKPQSAPILFENLTVSLDLTAETEFPSYPLNG